MPALAATGPQQSHLFVDERPEIVMKHNQNFNCSLAYAICLITTGMLACDDGRSADEATPTKEDAARMGGKADHVDLCEALHWYGDGVCDDFCPSPDPDCGGMADGGACPPVHCTLACEHGLVTDPETGCDLCECAEPDGGPCPPVHCTLACEYGLVADPETGCDLCECAPYDPCADLLCGDSCSVCAPDDSDCIETAVLKYCQDDGSCDATVPECRT